MKRFFCISALFLCAACANDLGNYDYRDLTEPDITGIEANISVLTHARLQLTPDLGGNDFPDDRYSFEWRTLARSADETVTVIGTSRNLDYEVALPAGAYTLFFKVTEDASGVYWQTSSELQVSEATSEGWMVLCADGADDRARLDMVSAVTGETYTDLLKDNGMPEMKGPRRIQWSRFADADSPYYLLTDDGATRLGRNGFEWKEEYRLIYEMGNSDDPRPWVINDASGSKMMVSDSKTYYAECLVSVGLFGPIGDTPLNAAPVIGSNIVTQNIVVPVVMMYDLDAKRFVGYAPNLRSPDVGGYAPLQEMNDLVKLLGEMDNGRKGHRRRLRRIPPRAGFRLDGEYEIRPEQHEYGCRLHRIEGRGPVLPLRDAAGRIMERRHRRRLHAGLEQGLLRRPLGVYEHRAGGAFRIQLAEKLHVLCRGRDGLPRGPLGKAPDGDDAVHARRGDRHLPEIQYLPAERQPHPHVRPGGGQREGRHGHAADLRGLQFRRKFPGRGARGPHRAGADRRRGLP